MNQLAFIVLALVPMLVVVAAKEKNCIGGELDNAIFPDAVSTCHSPNVTVVGVCTSKYVLESLDHDVAAVCCNGTWKLANDTGKCVQLKSDAVQTLGLKFPDADIAENLCAVVGFDTLTLYGPGADNTTERWNLTDATKIEGSCGDFVPNNDTTSFNRAHIDVTYEFKKQSTVQFKFWMQQLGLYNSSGMFIPGTGNLSTWLNVVEVYIGGLFATNFTVNQQAAQGYSFDCGDCYCLNGNGYNLTVTHLLFDGFMSLGKVAPSSVDANQLCSTTPSDDDTTSKNQIGLIIGGVIAGVAVIGILAFVYTQCTKKTGYETLN